MIDAFILRIMMVLIPFDLPSSVGWTGAYIRGDGLYLNACECFTNLWITTLMTYNEIHDQIRREIGVVWIDWRLLRDQGISW